MATSSEGISRPATPVMRRAWFTPESLAGYLQVSERMVRKWVSASAGEAKSRGAEADGP
jgi:hypothetical protein